LVVGAGILVAESKIFEAEVAYKAAYEAATRAGSRADVNFSLKALQDFLSSQNRPDEADAISPRYRH
jgi:hypothetical protein